MKLRERKTQIIIASGAVVIALLVMLVSVLPTIDSRSVNEERQGATSLSYQYEVADTFELERQGYIVVGDSPLTASVEAALASLNVNRTTITALSPDLDLSRTDVLLVDGPWLAETENGAAVLSSLSTRGVTVFIVNGTAEDLAALIPSGPALSSLSSTSHGKGPAVRGISVGPDGGPSAIIEIGGDAADPSELSKAVTSAVNWTSNRGHIPLSKSTNPYPGTPYLWNLTMVHYYYSGDALEPYGRIAFQNYYYDWVSDEEFTGVIGPLVPDDRMVHYKVQADPGWAVYGNEYRLSRLELAFKFTPRTIVHYAPHTIASGENAVNLATIVVPGKEQLSPAVWSFATALSDSDMSSISFEGLAGWGCDYAPGAYYAGRSSAIEPGVTFSCGPDGVGFSGTCSVTWAKAGLVSWDKHIENVELAGTLR